MIIDLLETLSRIGAGSMIVRIPRGGLFQVCMKLSLFQPPLPRKNKQHNSIARFISIPHVTIILSITA